MKPIVEMTEGCFMKSLEDVQILLQKFEQKFGFPVVGAQQKSAVWFQLKLGVISASNAHKAVAGKTTETRATYMAELVAQVATGIMEEINAKALDWGNQHEDAARSAYEFSHGRIVTQLPFVFKDESFRVGCSPDGFVTDHTGIEIKCPFNSTNYIKFLCEDKIKSEYHWQTQFQIWVLGASEWEVCQYDPRVLSKPLHTVTVPRDEECMKKFDDLIPAFISDMDTMLAKCGFSHGQQWERIGEQTKAEVVA